MTPPRLIAGPAVIMEGYSALVLAVILRGLARRGQFDTLAATPRANLLQTIAALERVGALWRVEQERISGDGSSETPPAPEDAPSLQEHMTIEEAAMVLKVTPRRMRQLAAGGLGTKHGHTWLVDRSAVLAEVERREVA